MRVSCSVCGGGTAGVSSVDEYNHDGITVTILACDCGGEGTCLDYPHDETIVEGDLEVAR
jgi:hypothetical protein